MKNALKYQAKYVLHIFVGTFLGMGVYATIMGVFSSEASFILMPMMSIMFVLLAPWITLQSLNSVYFAMALSYGATRKNYSMALQIVKIAISAAITAIVLAAVYYFTGDIAGYFYPAITVFFACFLIASIGEFIGVSMIKFSRVVNIIIGIITFVLLFSGGIYTGFMAADNFDGAMQFTVDIFLGNANATFINITSISLFALCAVVTLIARQIALKVNITN